VVADQPALSFAGLLRQLRAEARLTQEELAEAAGVGTRSLSDLERGISRTAHKDTARLLAGALGLPEPVAELFVAAARGRGSATDVLAARRGQPPGAFAAAATRALPRDIASFTGRRAELALLTSGLGALAANGGVVGIHAIDGMAGIGKTAFAVHAAHRLAGSFPDGQFFLPLHAHTAGQRPVDPADALASLLLTAGVPAAHIPPGLEARAGRWRDQVAGKKILLVLDDAAGHEQVRPLLPGTAGSLVLVTSRRRLTALEDAAVISLDTLPREDAAALLARLASRPGLASGEGPVGEITRLCGYLPLAIGMMASQLRHHPAWSVAQLAADLAAARDLLAFMQAENLSVAAAFDLSHQDLTPGPQRLFRRLGLIPGPSFDGYAAAALDGTGINEARRHLGELYDQHLLTEPAPGRYQLHDLLREHARALADADNPAESDAAAGRLLDYYLHTALTASQRIPRWDIAPGVPALEGTPPADAPDLSTPEQAAAWLEEERTNLHAAADHAAAGGRHLTAIQIPAAIGDFLRTRGHWDEAASLHRTALAAARQAGDRGGQARALHELGLLAWMTSDYPAAAARLAQAAALYADIDDRPGQGIVLNILGHVQMLTGDYPAAIASHQQALNLARGSGDRLAEAVALGVLGLTQQYTGDYPAAAANLAGALALFRSQGHRHGQADVLNDLGTLQTLTGDYQAAGANLQQALETFRDLGDRPFQAWALNDLGVVQQLTGDYPAAAASHQQALELFGDLGNQLGRAEALNRLGELSLRTSATGQARDQHAQALAIARHLGVPVEEARALEGIGNSHLHEGNPSQATAHLRQALAIYQRIGAPAAQRVQETLQRHGLASTCPEHQPADPSSEGHQPSTRAAP
jgi:tetratricopeptide (TPR) repeat protein/transcriptional regulator with XRE-family HTH domain